MENHVTYQGYQPVIVVSSRVICSVLLIVYQFSSPCVLLAGESVCTIFSKLASHNGSTPNILSVLKFFLMFSFFVI